MSSQEGVKRSHMEILQEFSIPLLAGVVVALVWANVDFESYHHAMDWAPLILGGHPISFHFVINDIFMALFFGIATKEITEACLPGGALNPPKKAINPLLGTLGGVLGPALVYLAYCHMIGDTMDFSDKAGVASIANGWGIPTATDIALAWLIARMCFGNKHPAVSFLLLLAVADDGIGLGIIAIFYGDPAHPAQPAYLGMVLAAMVVAFLMRKKNVQSFWPYLLIPGGLSWFGLILAHLHPALALVAVVPFMPAAEHDVGLFAEEGAPEPHDYHDTLNHFEHFFKAPVDFGLFGFGLANAGVALSAMGDPTWAVLLGLLLGKTIGITLLSGIGHMVGFPLPDGMNMKTLFVASIIAALGLTVALFVAGAAFTDPGIQGAAKMGALFSAAAAPLALIVARVLRVKKMN
jgi:NhaA family Na+:H+ antiporter